MPLASLSPVVGVVAGATVANFAKKIGDSLSFANVLQGSSAEPSEPNANSASSTTADPSQASLPDLRQRAQDLLTQLQNALQRRFAAAGIDLSVPVRLQSDSFGGIEANPDHPDRAAIDQILSSDPTLASLFHQVEAAYGQLHESKGSAWETSGNGHPALTVLLSGDQIDVSFASA